VAQEVSHRKGPRTGVSRWLGERMDYDIAIEGLMQRDGLGGSRCTGISSQNLPNWA
jgi:hypothetical protein